MIAEEIKKKQYKKFQELNREQTSGQSIESFPSRSGLVGVGAPSWVRVCGDIAERVTILEEVPRLRHLPYLRKLS